MSSAPAQGHSSTVHIRLKVDECILRVAQVGESSLILRESFECPPESEGEIVIVVDGHKSVYHVILDEGITRGMREVKFSDIQPPPRHTERLLFSELDDVPF
jgi:hypothetical protein